MHEDVREIEDLKRRLAALLERLASAATLEDVNIAAGATQNELAGIAEER